MNAERETRELVIELNEMLNQDFEQEIEAKYRAAKLRFEAMTQPDLPLLTDQ
jgi:hypothetical protein